MPNIDERVVQMSFDNAQFEAGVSKSMNTLEKLKNALNFDGAADSFEKLEESSKDINFSHLSSSVDSIAEKFTLLGQIGLKAMDKIATSVVNAGEKLVKGISIDQVNKGFSKYETRTKAVQTIMAATGKSVEEVEEVLNDLMDYTDMTSYDFSEMAASIGKFTSVGVDLKVAEKAMEGIANEAALSGAGIQEANRAMYNFAQALSAGSVKLIDWKSIENANMATKEFKEELIKTAIAMGTLNTENGQTGVIMKQTKKATKNAAAEFRKTEVNYQSFNQTLSEGWLTSEVLIETLNRYGDTTNELGNRAYEAAKVALTFTQAIEAVKDAVSSGWMKSFNLMFGNVEEAGKLWTGFCDAIIDVVGQIGEYRNAVLEVWHNGSEESGISGYISMIEAAKNIWETFTNVLYAARDAIASIIPPATGEDLIAITEKIRIASENLAKFLHYDGGITVEEEIAVTKNLLDGLNPKNLKLGQTSDDAKQLNKALTEMGYLGEVTVSAFQDISKNTTDLTPGAFDTIDANSSVEKVKTLQEALIKAGVATDGFVADGVYGPKTKAAIIALQKQVGVEQTGIWDRATAYAASNDNRYHIKAMSDKYTTATEAAVKKFQKKFGLEETGIWDDATQKVAEASGAFEKAQKKNLVKGLDSDLKTGDATKGVKQLQEALVEAGIATEDLVADGIYGPKTEAAVKKLQRELKVAETGVWDETTREAAKTYDKFNKIETTMGEVVKHAGEQYKVTKYLEHTIDHAQELNFSVKIGARGADVTKLQEQLQNAGYSVGAAGADGIYGPQTKAAIEKLQADLDVKVTGVWDKATREAAIREGVFTEVKGEMVEVTETVESSSNAILNFQNIVAAGASILSFFGKVIGIVVGVGKHLAELFAPLGDAIFNVVGLVAGLITNTEQELEATGAFEIVLNSINTALDFLAPIINTVADAINGFVDSIYEADVYTLGDLFAFLGDKIKTAFKELREKYPVLDTIISLFEFARDSIIELFKKLTGWDGKLSMFENVGKIFTNVKKTIVKNIKKIKNKLKPNIFGNPIQKILYMINWIKEELKMVWDPKKSFGDNLKAAFKEIGRQLNTFRKDIPILDTILNIKEKIVDLYKTIKGYTFDDEGKFVLFDKIKAKVEEIKQSIGDFFTGIREKYPIVDNILKAFEWIQEKFNGIVSSLTWDNKKSFKDNIITNVNIIKDKVGEALAELRGKFDQFVNDTPILKFLSGIFDSIKGFAFDDEGNFVFFDNVKAKIDEIRTSIDNFFNGLRDNYPIIDKIFKAFEWLKKKIDGIKAALSWDPEKTFGENIGAAFDVIKEKAGEAFDEIKEKINNFLAEHPQLQKAIDTFNLVKDAIVGFFTVDTSGEEGVGGKLQKRLEKLQPLFDGILEFVQSDTFRNIAIAIGSALLLGLVVALTGIGPILWEALKNGVASLAQNNPLIGSFATTVFNPFARFIEGLFGDLFKGTNSFGWDSEKSFGENIQNNLQILQDNITTILANIRGKIEEFINSPAVQGFISKIRPIIDFLVFTFNKIRQAITLFFSADTSGDENPLEKLKTRLSQAAKPLIEWFQKLKERIVRLWNSIFHPESDDKAEGDSKKSTLLETLKNLVKKYTDKLKNGKLIGIGIGVLLAALGVTLYKVGEAINDIVLRYYVAKSKVKKDTLGDTFLKIAGAIALIAIAIGALAIVNNYGDIDKAFQILGQAMIAIVTFTLIFAFFLGAIGKWAGKDIQNVGKGLKNIAMAVLMIIISIVGVALLIGQAIADPAFGVRLIAALVIVAGILIGLGLFSAWVTNIGGSISNGGKGIHPVLQMCAGILVLSWALDNIAKTINKQGWAVLGAVVILGAMLVLVGAITYFLIWASKMGKDEKSANIKGILRMCIGVYVLSWALTRVSNVIKNNGFGNAITGMIWLLLMTALVGFIASGGMIKDMKNYNGVKGILSMCAGVYVLALAIDKVAKTMNAYGGWDVAGGIGWLVLIVVLIAGVIAGLATIGKGKEGRKDLAGAVGSMVITMVAVGALVWWLVKQLEKVKDVDWKVMTAFLGGIAAIVIIIGLMTALSAAISAGNMILGGVGLAVALILVGLALGLVVDLGLNAVRKASAILVELGGGISLFSDSMKDVNIETLADQCKAVKDHVVPMLKAVAQSKIKSENKQFTSILRRVGISLGHFVKDTADANPEKIKSLKSIPGTVKYICDKLGEISNADKRTVLDDVGASLAQFFDLTKNVNNNKSETLKAIAQTAKDVADIALTIGDATDITDKLVSVGSGLYVYQLLSKDLEMPSEDDPGLKLAKNAKEVSNTIMEIGNSADIVDKLVSIGGALSLYSNLMRGIEIEGSDVLLENVSDDDVGMVLANSVVSIYNSLKEIKAEEFEAIESNIVLLGGALRLYYKSLGEIETVTEDGEEIDIDPATVTKVLNTMAEALPDADLFKQSFEQVKALAPETEDGVDNLALFSAGVSALGVAIGDYADNVGKLKDKESEINGANAILGMASSIWKNFENDQVGNIIPSDDAIANGESFGEVDSDTKGSRNMSSFSAGIEALGKAISDYATNIGGLKNKKHLIDLANGVIDKAADIWTNFADDSKIPTETSVNNVESMNGGSRNLNNFTGGIAALGKAIGDYANKIGTNLQGKTQQIKDANSIIDKAAGIWSRFNGTRKIPSERSVSNISRLNDMNGTGTGIAGFAGGIRQLGVAIGSYATNLKDINPDDIEQGNIVIDKVASIKETLNNNAAATSEISGAILGFVQLNASVKTPSDSDLVNFGEDIEAIGQSVGAYVTAINGIGQNAEDIEHANGIVGSLAGISTSLPHIGGLNQWFEGEQSLSYLSIGMTGLGKAVAKFVKELVDNNFHNNVAKLTNQDKLSALSTIMTIIGDMAVKLPRSGIVHDFFTGASDLTEFATKLSGLGTAISSFVGELITGDFSGKMDAFDDGDLDKFVVLEAFLSGVNDIATIARDLEYAKYEGRMPDMAESLIQLLNNLASIDLSRVDWAGIDDFYATINEHLAGGIPTGSGSGEDGDDVVSKAFALIFAGIRQDATDTAHDDAFWKGIGETICTYLTEGIKVNNTETGANSPYRAFKAMLLKLVGYANILKYNGTWKKIGHDIDTGLAQGIREYSYDVENAGEDLMEALKQAARNAIDSNSPSKDFMEIGNDIDEGLIIGLQKYSEGVEGAGGELTEGALTAAKGGLSAISNLLSDDIDANPTIRPVLDLSEIQAQAGTLNGYFGQRTMGLRVATPTVTANRISASEQRNSAARNSSDGGLATAVTNLDEKVEALGNKLSSLKIVMNSGKLVGEIAGDMDRELGRRTWRKGRLN